MKKICLVIHSLRLGGMERVMSELAANFSKRENIHVDLVLIGRTRKISYAIPDTVRVHRPGFTFRNSRRRFDTVRTIWFLRKKVKEIEPDTVLGFGEIWNNLVLLALYGLSYPVFISDRSEPDKNLGRVHNFLRNVLYPTAAGYIAQTGKAKSVVHQKKWNRNVAVIGNPIRNIPHNGYTEKENIVLTVGRLIKTKHFDELIRIFAEIDHPDWKLVIVGGDAKKQNQYDVLKKLIEDLKVTDSVFLEGYQKNVDQYYKKSKIFAFTSSSEGFPNVIGEAMSAGLPVVAYDCDAGPSDIINQNENGFLVPLFDRETFRIKLHQLMTDVELRGLLSANSKQSIRQYDSDKIADKFYKFILSV